MTIEEKVIQILRDLPNVRQQELLNFAEFLRSREPETPSAEREPSTAFGHGLAEFRKVWQIETLDIEPDEIFGAVRDPSPGREVTL